MRRVGVEGEVLLGHVGRLLLDVIAELLGRDALLLQVDVERHAGALELVEEVLKQVGLHFLDEALRHFAIEALGEGGKRAALLEAREDGILLGLELLANLVAERLDGLDADLVLDPLVGELGQLLLLDREHLDVEVDLGGLAHERSRRGVVLGRRVDRELLRLALLHAGDLLVELLRVHAGAHAVLEGLLGEGGDLVAVVVGGRNLQLDVLVFLDLRVRRSVDVLDVVLAKRVDLLFDLGIIDALGGHLDLDRVVAGQLGSRLDVEFEVVAVRGLVGDDVRILVELDLADGVNTRLVDGQRHRLVDHIVGHERAHVILAQRAVDDGARGLPATEARDVVLVRDFLVLLLDAVSDHCVVDRDGHLDAIAFQGLDFSFHLSILRFELSLLCFGTQTRIIAHNILL